MERARACVAVAVAPALTGLALLSPATPPPAAPYPAGGLPGGAAAHRAARGAPADHPADLVLRVPPGRRDQADSRNWSGYVAHGGTYTSVAASWVEPSARCVPGYQYSGFWVGLDGYASKTVEQAGTEADCAGGAAAYYSWYEMYPNHPVVLSDTTSPGDRVSASVAYAGNGRFTIRVADATRGWSHAVTMAAPGVARSSAEVVIEAPYFGADIMPLADFGTATFSGAVVNGYGLGTFDVTQITMVSAGGTPKATVSPLAGGQGLTAAWHGG